MVYFYSALDTRTFVYSGNLLTSATNPENGTVTYTYNSYNKVATRTDAKGQATVYTYDGTARLTEVQHYPQGTSNAEDTCQRVIYSYDSNPYVSNYSNYTSGRLAAVQYYGGSSTYAYSNANCDTTFTEMYNYNQAGGKLGKWLRVTRTLASGNPNNYTTWQYNPTNADLQSSYTFDNEGRITAVQYPSWGQPSSPTAGPDLGYAMDTMGRLNTMTDLAAQTGIINATTYGPSSEMLTMSGQVSEVRTYNSLLQLTNVTNGSVNISYNYPSTQNNGKIASQTDNLSGEQVVYAYDALNRLSSAGATSGSWGQSYAYDGFGNLTDQNVTAGSAPAYHVTINAATNQRTGDCADANGNTYGGSGCYPGYGYDVENRMVGGYQTFQYSYAPSNKRVWRGVWSNGSLSTDEITFWSTTGQKLATYQLSVTGGVINNSSSTAVLVATQSTTNYYFGGKLVKNANGYVGTDRLGSVGRFYPYGQEKPSATTNGTEKFTGYFRDAETGMDYAHNRYHNPGTGRFLTPDSYMLSAGPSTPISWNRYAYVGGDPSNRTDRAGLEYYDVSGDVNENDYDCEDPADCQTDPANDDGPGNVCPDGQILRNGECTPLFTADVNGNQPTFIINVDWQLPTSTSVNWTYSGFPNGGGLPGACPPGQYMSNNGIKIFTSNTTPTCVSGLKLPSNTTIGPPPPPAPPLITPTVANCLWAPGFMNDVNTARPVDNSDGGNGYSLGFAGSTMPNPNNANNTKLAPGKGLGTMLPTEGAARSLGYGLLADVFGSVNSCLQSIRR